MRRPPYEAQWASPELVADILGGALRAVDDPRWAESGARDRDEYEFWSWRACGMAAFRSWLGTVWDLDEVPGVVALAREVERAGGYRVRPDGSGVDGLTYAPFVDYVTARWSFRAEVAAPLDVDQIVGHVRDGGAVMASVSPELRWHENGATRKGGHLVLVFGGDEEALLLHNPSGDTAASQADVRIDCDVFEDFFAGRGVLLWPPDLHKDGA